MNIEALRYAAAVGEARSFSAAARAYGLTQPALSNAIARLEQELGARMFTRSTRGVTATAFGRRLLPLIDRAVASVDAISAEAGRATQPQPRSIRLGVSPLIDTGLVSAAFSAVRVLDEPRDLILREDNLDDLHADLARGALDVIIVPAVTPMPRFQHRELGREPVVVVCSEGATEPLEVSNFGAGPLILMPDTCGLTRFTEGLLDRHALPVQRYAGEAQSVTVLEDWARLGLGSAVLPQSKLHQSEANVRPLTSAGRAVEIAYEAVWSAQSPCAADIEAVVTIVTAG